MEVFFDYSDPWDLFRTAVGIGSVLIWHRYLHRGMANLVQVAGSWVFFISMLVQNGNGPYYTLWGLAILVVSCFVHSWGFVLQRREYDRKLRQLLKEYEHLIEKDCPWLRN